MSNQAAWITEAKANPVKVDKADIPKPGSNEVIIKNGAIAINPVDWKIQDYGIFVQNYPMVLGTDVAGEVVEVGSDVKGFKKGDRVLSHALSLMTGKPANGGFQLYTAAFASFTSKIPDNMAFTDATVLPLAVSTAAAGLYPSDILGLPLPSKSPKDSGKVILIWGGSSSVGTVTIQLARASGVHVIATASKHNFDFVKSLGASEVFDYNSPSVVDDILSAIKASGKEFAGIYDSISEPASTTPSIEILQKAGGAKKIGTVLPPPENLPEGVQATNILAFSIGMQYKDVGEAIWGKFVPAALEEKTLKALPPALVVGKGLEHVQEGLNMNKKGVSAKKVVIEL